MRRMSPNGSPEALPVRLSDALTPSPTPPLVALDIDPRRDGADEQSESCDSRRRIAGRSSSAGSAADGSGGEPETERGDDARGDKGSTVSSAGSAKAGGGVNRRLSVVGDAMATADKARARVSWDVTDGQRRSIITASALGSGSKANRREIRSLADLRYCVSDKGDRFAAPHMAK